MSKYTVEQAEKYKDKYDEGKLWKKIKRYSKKVGYEGIRSALLLYYALENPNLPTKMKGVIYGALAYFVSPLDIIPDIIPIVGFTDDIGIILAAIAAVGFHIDADVRANADIKLKDWFGDSSC